MKGGLTIVVLLLTVFLSTVNCFCFNSATGTNNPSFVSTFRVGRYCSRTPSSPTTKMSSSSNTTTTVEPFNITDNEGDDSSFIAGPRLPPIPQMSKRLFLVRHGEVINPGGTRPVYYGAMDVPLSPLGEEEAKAAGQYLQQFEALEYVFSSPLSRAIYGANRVLEYLNLHRSRVNNGSLSVIEENIENVGFTELDRGSWCGKTLEEIGQETMDKFNACDESVTPDGGESYPTLKQRVLSARDEVLETLSPGKAAAVVSHLQVTRSMLSDALDIPTEQMSQIKIETASITCIDYDSVTGTQTVYFQSFKPNVGLAKSIDGAN